MWLCTECIGSGYCRNLNTRLVSDSELKNHDFVEDVRSAARALGLSPSSWRDFIYDTYRDYPGRVISANGQEAFLDLNVFETDGVREWFRDWVYSPQQASRTRTIRAESKERVRVIATLLRASNPRSAIAWGVRAANDNRKPSNS